MGHPRFIWLAPLTLPPPQRGPAAKEKTMTRIFSLIMVLLTLVACAGNNQVPATAVVVPANALPSEEVQKLASPIIYRGQFKGNHNSDDHPIRLLSSYNHLECLFMYDGSTTRPRNARNINADGKDDVKQPLVAIGFHSGNATCGLKHTHWLVPYVFAAIGYRLPAGWLFVANDTHGNWVHCWMSRRNYNPMVYPYSWCKPV